MLDDYAHMGIVLPTDVSEVKLVGSVIAYSRQEDVVVEVFSGRRRPNTNTSNIALTSIGSATARTFVDLVEGTPQRRHQRHEWRVPDRGRHVVRRFQPTEPDQRHVIRWIHLHPDGHRMTPNTPDEYFVPELTDDVQPLDRSTASLADVVDKVNELVDLVNELIRRGI